MYHVHVCDLIVPPEIKGPSVLAVEGFSKRRLQTGVHEMTVFPTKTDQGGLEIALNFHTPVKIASITLNETDWDRMHASCSREARPPVRQNRLRVISSECLPQLSWTILGDPDAASAPEHIANFVSELPPPHSSVHLSLPIVRGSAARRFRLRLAGDGPGAADIVSCKLTIAYYESLQNNLAVWALGIQPVHGGTILEAASSATGECMYHLNSFHKSPLTMGASHRISVLNGRWKTSESNHHLRGASREAFSESQPELSATAVAVDGELHSVQVWKAYRLPSTEQSMDESNTAAAYRPPLTPALVDALVGHVQTVPVESTADTDTDATTNTGVGIETIQDIGEGDNIQYGTWAVLGDPSAPVKACRCEGCRRASFRPFQGNVQPVMADPGHETVVEDKISEAALKVGQSTDFLDGAPVNHESMGGFIDALAAAVTAASHSIHEQLPRGLGVQGPSTPWQGPIACMWDIVRMMTPANPAVPDLRVKASHRARSVVRRYPEWQSRGRALRLACHDCGATVHRDDHVVQGARLGVWDCVNEAVATSSSDQAAASAGHSDGAAPRAGSVGPVEAVYTFDRWQYIDVFVYFSHTTVTIPPPGWIAAAHANGVRMLGTLIFEGKVGDSRTKNTRFSTVSTRP